MLARNIINPCFIIFACILPANILADTVILAWDRDRTAVTGYHLYYWTATEHYAHKIDVGNAAWVPVPNLTEGQTYFFAVTAYNKSEESFPSNQVRYTVPISAGAGSENASAGQRGGNTMPAATPMAAASVPPTRSLGGPAPRRMAKATRLLNHKNRVDVRNDVSIEAAAYARWCRGAE
jgi:Fibronectin type III domain